MAAAVERTDELVREYLLFRGFTATLKQLDVEIKADKEKGFRVRAAEKDARRPELAGRHAGAGEGKEGMRSGGRLSAPASGCASPPWEFSRRRHSCAWKGSRAEQRGGLATAPR